MHMKMSLANHSQAMNEDITTAYVNARSTCSSNKYVTDPNPVRSVLEHLPSRMLPRSRSSQLDILIEKQAAKCAISCT